ncbi:hypothetical protein HDC90_001124 [Pedobacter sp. AK013]|uniref:hypothetical protein n=1 Tax=Pedobacter sp. AK013 TaxID=2723071 RepID=UPI00161B96EC|nr:hypothetical protein [Pedobacter sp. AK013]MBB6236512.1 hypothetical protein [Pedobacter sp. AK013]
MKSTSKKFAIAANMLSVSPTGAPSTLSTDEDESVRLELLKWIKGYTSINKRLPIGKMSQPGAEMYFAHSTKKLLKVDYFFRGRKFSYEFNKAELWKA